MIQRNKTRIPSAISASVALLLSSTAMTALSTSVLAQDNPVLEEIQVTGTRIRTSDFDTPNPTTVVDSSYLQNLGIVNLGDAMVQIPSNVSTFTPQATGNSNFFAGSTIANLRGINPYFGSRTLTLVDGRRHVPTNQGDGVDLNFIPTILLQRMDVVTGGASAAYGSGAISGVNNIILNKRLEGFKVDLDYGISGEGDGDSYHGAAAWGTALADGRGHLVLAGEYQKQDRVGCEDARDWCASAVGYLNNANGGNARDSDYIQLDPSLPNYVKRSGLNYNGISKNGVIWGNAAGVPAFEASADGTTVHPFALGLGPDGLPSTSVGGAAIGGDGLGLNHYTNLISESERHTLHGHFDYDLTDTMNFGIDAEYGKVKTRNESQPFTTTYAALNGVNPFLPDPYGSANPYVVENADIASAVGIFSFLNKDWADQVDSYSTFDTEVWSIAGDLNGQFGDSSWTWDTYLTHGHTKRTQLVAGNPHLNSLGFAIDAVYPYIDPTNPLAGVDTTAAPVCRVTRDGVADPLLDPTLADGCVPINPFGTGDLTAAQEAYGFGYLLEDEIVNQTVAAGNVSGDLFDGFGAGPVGAAFGGEYRIEDIKNINRSGAPATDYLIQYGDSFQGKVNVWETFGEVHVPLVADAPLFEKLEIDAAIRYSHYKNTGQGPSFATGSHGLTTWKLSGIWDVTEWFRIRGSQSRDARAGNFRELYYGQLIHAGGFFGYCGSGFRQDPCDLNLQGNPNVTPEVSDTSTVGVVFTPTGSLDGFQFAADYYHIKLKNGITPAGGQTQDVITLCREQGTLTCDTPLGSLIFDSTVGDPSTWTVQSVTDYSYNARSYAVKGVDISANYNHTFDNGDMLNTRLIATKTFSQKVETTIGLPPRNIVGQTGSANGFLPDFQSSPDWVANLSVTYNKGGFSGTLQGRYIASGKYDFYGIGPDDADYRTNLSYTYDDNKISFYQIYTLNLSYTFEDMIGAGSSLQVYGTVNNLFDKDPDPTGSAVYYDRLGRMFRFGIRSTF